MNEENVFPSSHAYPEVLRCTKNAIEAGISISAHLASIHRDLVQLFGVDAVGEAYEQIKQEYMETPYWG